MDEKNPKIPEIETTHGEHELKHSITAPAENEDEPQTPYQLEWKTILTLLTLSMGNVCAALANTVC
jgi:hypothetical protein